MSRAAVCWLAVLLLLGSGGLARADAFDQYTNPVLARLLASPNAREVKQLTPDDLLDNDRVLPGTPSTFLVLQTNQGRKAKLLVRDARQKVPGKGSLPLLLVERFVCYKEGEERTIASSGQNVALFPGFRLSLDLGQVVPAELGGDLQLLAEGKKVVTQPLGKARLFLVTKALADVTPKKGARLVVGDTFEPRYFDGTYKLQDDGRRSGTLSLTVGNNGSVSGTYYSDKDGQKYEVRGKVGTPPYTVQFVIKFPQADQVFQGWLFTGNARALVGTSRLAEREAGFYALRVEE